MRHFSSAMSVVSDKELDTVSYYCEFSSRPRYITNEHGVAICYEAVAKL